MSTQPVYEMTAAEAIMSRSSATKLELPAPTSQDLDVICRAADRAPDHGRLRPWRVLIVEGEKIGTYGDLLADSLLRRKPDANVGDLDRERAKAKRAPMILVVSAAVDKDSKIPAIEQILAVSAATQNMFLMAHSLGYGMMWKTGDAAYDPDFKEALGIGRNDAIVGFLYVGSPSDVGPVHAAQLDFVRVL